MHQRTAARSRAAVATALAATLAVVAVACSSSPSSAPATTSTTEAAPATSGAATATTSGGPYYHGPDAGAHVLASSDLPAGFVAYPKQRPPRLASQPPAKVDTGGSGLCGLANPADTSDPLDRIQVGYARRAAGPFLYETVAIYRTAAQAAKVFASAQRGLAGCIATGARQQPAIEGSTLDVGPLGDQRAAFAVHVVGPSAPVTTSAPAGPAMGATTGRFYVQCSFSHRAIADPIVHPASRSRHGTTTTEGGGGAMGMGDMPGMEPGVPGHSHDFFGATSTDAASTAASLLDSSTTCSDRHDRSAYWAPTLYRSGHAVAPVRLRAWYSAPTGSAVGTLHALPDGLQLIAGDQAATTPQRTSVAGWRCGDDELGAASSAPPSGCPASAPLTLQLHYPDCWDGHHLSSADHRSHVAYDVRGRCPATHPVALVQLAVTIDYGLHGSPGPLELAMGPTRGAHGDALLAWAGTQQQVLIDRCIRTGTDCAAGVGPADLPAYAHAVLVRKGATIVLLASAGFDPLDASLTRTVARTAVTKIPA